MQKKEIMAKNMKGEDAKAVSQKSLKVNNPITFTSADKTLKSTEREGYDYEPATNTYTVKGAKKKYSYKRNDKTGKLYMTNLETGETGEAQEYEPNSLLMGDKAKKYNADFKAKQDSSYNVNAPKTAERRKKFSMNKQ